MWTCHTSESSMRQTPAQLLRPFRVKSPVCTPLGRGATGEAAVAPSGAAGTSQTWLPGPTEEELWLKKVKAPTSPVISSAFSCIPVLQLLHGGPACGAARIFTTYFVTPCMCFLLTHTSPPPCSDTNAELMCSGVQHRTQTSMAPLYIWPCTLSVTLPPIGKFPRGTMQVTSAGVLSSLSSK